MDEFKNGSNSSKLKLKIKAGLLIGITLLLAFSALTRCSYVPYTFKTQYVDMKLPEDMSGPKRGFYLAVAVGNQIFVTSLLTYMDVYEYLFLETGPINITQDPVAIVLASSHFQHSDLEKGRYFDWEGDGFAEWSEFIEKDQFVVGRMNKVDFRIDPIITYGDYSAASVLSRSDDNGDGVLNKSDKSFEELYVIFLSPQTQKTSQLPLKVLFESIDLKSGNAKSTFGKQENKNISVWKPHALEVNSMYARPYNVKMALRYIVAFPSLRGYGHLAALPIAMTQNAELAKAVGRLSECQLSRVLSDLDGYNQQVENILFLWAGVRHIDPKSRGPFVDARKLSILEKLTAKNFVQIGKWINPRPFAAIDINRAWDEFFAHERDSLLFQTCGRQLFDSKSVYLPSTDDLKINGVRHDTIARLRLEASKKGKEEVERQEKNLQTVIKSMLKSYNPLKQMAL